MRLPMRTTERLHKPEIDFPLVVHMYISDGGSERNVELVCPYIAKLGYTSANRRKAYQCFELIRDGADSSESLGSRGVTAGSVRVVGG